MRVDAPFVGRTKACTFIRVCRGMRVAVASIRNYYNFLSVRKFSTTTMTRTVFMAETRVKQIARLPVEKKEGIMTIIAVIFKAISS